MTARNLDPSYLTDTQVDSITVFAGAHTPVKDQLVLIKKKQLPDDVKELTCQLRMLVKDSARKLNTSNLRRQLRAPEVQTSRNLRVSNHSTLYPVSLALTYFDRVSILD